MTFIPLQLPPGIVRGANPDDAPGRWYDATLQSLSSLGTAADRYAYTTGVDTWAEGTITSAGRALLDDADASAQRTTLGLGNLATLNTVGTSQIDNNSVNGAKTLSGSLERVRVTTLLGTATFDAGTINIMYE